MDLRDPNAPDFTRLWTNLADPRLGAAAIFATDDFFAPMARMLNPAPAVFIPDKYDDNGKWMDGWESRRKRQEGYDHCIVRLGRPGSIMGVDIDTSHFTGNYPPGASVDACAVTGDPDAATVWTTVLPAQSLNGNAHHYFEVGQAGPWTHVRLNIYPDGGVARFRVYGRVHRDWSGVDRSAPVDLIALENGGRFIAASDQHYGSPANMLAPGRAENMGGGWETRRRREPGNEWAILELGHRGRIVEAIVDTHHFKGNFPDRCSIQAADVTFGTDKSVVTQSMFWRALLPETKLKADTAHSFKAELADLGPITHIRINVIPDGGVSRLRLPGLPS